jgi:predicted nucleic-acid-binding protein
MIAVDTNILVRLLTKDDERQYNASLRLFQRPAIFISDTVVLETEWVLRFAYGFQPDDLCTGLRKLFGLPNVHLSNGHWMAQALQWHEDGLDFADALHLATSQRCTELYTFDDRFTKRGKQLADCSVCRLES